MSAFLGPFLRTVHDNALTDAVDHGLVGSEADEFADRVTSVTAETIEHLERQRDQMLDAGDR
ncbi:hypothetical protein A6A04_13290 [Paramagnetospirillum marisnigri]|uniref:Uncharacterized protein n=2 Tax=Paramagnetospirillum marisnigri TaxID=1285242 RepID=A0A178MV42_9PROT|nr:hypothetical protein A6A04_13290 [Paramagnetospirillum marisnigri]